MRPQTVAMTQYSAVLDAGGVKIGKQRATNLAIQILPSLLLFIDGGAIASALSPNFVHARLQHLIPNSNKDCNLPPITEPSSGIFAAPLSITSIRVLGIRIADLHPSWAVCDPRTRG